MQLKYVKKLKITVPKNMQLNYSCEPEITNSMILIRPLI